MTVDDNINETNDVDNSLKTKVSKNDEFEKKKKDIDTRKNENDNTYEQREKRDRSSSRDSFKPEKKKVCCCHETNNAKCSKYEKNNSTIKNKNVDSLSTASTGINEFVNNSNNINEPFKFFIGGIPQNITNKDIIEYFEKYGTVQSVVIAQDHETKRNRGFAFVTMLSQINKERILRDSHELKGKRVDVREEHNTTPSDIQRKIFVGGLNYYWTKDTLESYFSTFGDIDVVQIVVDSSGRSRCFGFVVFANENSVAKVLKHKRHKIYDKMVEVRKAEPKKPKMAMKRQNTKTYPKYPHHNPFMAPFPYNKETMAQWANFMYNTCGVPFLFNQRFQNIPDFYSNYNYYPNSMDNLQQSEYNN
ncbi:RNA-binding protein, putative [Plasmodium relictum]|uniref:RNA-binding protein, putative n=1 Tax=Plasmodium relictum TaxID=85471 RepID=A0A1J1H249_PLARL|nr:RNA-binding protein, putative [Plasmodium relictum]CRG98939.1 RNA-binding protein, putative [Plasmodium relictum]